MAKRTKATPTPLTTSQQLSALISSARKIMRKDKGLNGDLDRLPLLTWIMFLKFLDDLELQREEEATLGGTKFKPAIEAPYRWRDWAADPQGITGDELLAFINNEEATGADGKKREGLFRYLRGLSSSDGDSRRDVIATVFKGVDNRMKSGYLLRDVINKVGGIHFTSTEELHTLGTLYESMLREMRDAAGDSGEFYTPRAVVRFMVQMTDPRLGETVLDPAAGTGGFLVEAFNHLNAQVKTVEDRRTLQRVSLHGGEPKPLPYLLCQMNLLLHGLDAPQIDPGNSLRFKLTEIGEKERVDVILTNPPFGGEEEKGIQGNFPEDLRTDETALLFLQLIMRRLKKSSALPGGVSRAAVVVPNGTMFGDGVYAKIKQHLLTDFNLHTVVRLPKGVFEPYTDIETNLLFFDRNGPTTEIWYYQQPPPAGRKNYSKTRPLLYEELADCIQWWSNRKDTARAWRVQARDIIANGCNLDVKNPHSSGGSGGVPIPTMAAQLVAKQKLLDAGLQAIQARLIKEKSLTDTQESGNRIVKLGDVLKLSNEFVKLEPDSDYKEVTVRMHGRGLTLRGVVKGIEIASATRRVVRAGQFLLARIDARQGACGIVPEELDGAVVTNDFLPYVFDTKRLKPDYMGWLSRTQPFVDKLKRASEGTTNRVRIKEHLFLSIEIPLPSLSEQERIVQRFEEVDRVRRLASETNSAMEDLLSEMLLDTFKL